LCVFLGFNASACVVCFDVVGIAVVTSLAGSWNIGFANGVGAQALFAYPSGVAVDANGTVFVADYGNNRIRAISPTGGTWGGPSPAASHVVR
jgi:DNA-binding beta-propeller fold protein YncE